MCMSRFLNMFFCVYFMISMNFSITGNKRTLRFGTEVFFFNFLFFNIFIDYAITVVPFPRPLLHSILPTPSLPHSPPIVHIHGSYLEVLWLLHFLHYSCPPPVYFPPIIYATYSLYLYPPLPLPLPC